MAHTGSLWSRSPPWRWVLCLTLLVTTLIVLIFLWHTPSGVNTAQAQYNPPITGQPRAINGSISPQNLHTPLDPAFDTTITLPTATFSSNTELHVVGVYEAALPKGEENKPWWSHCTGLSEDAAAMMACHTKYAGQRSTQEITIYLNQTNAPMVVALMAYNPIRWKIVARPGVDLRKVILAGYHGQDIEGIPDSIPIEVHSYESSPCMNCSRQADHFYAYEQGSSEYKQAMNKLQTLTGLTPASFQGAYKADRFTIASGTTPFKNAASTNQAEQFTGKTFNNYIEISQETLLLPDGLWRGLGYVENPSKRGKDQFLVLSQEDKNRLSALMVIRLQTVKDNQGFSQYSACNQPADYAHSVRENEPLGPQLCYWANHVSTPWQQPIYKLAASRLAALEVNLPDSVFSTGFHKADTNTSITTLYYFPPNISTQSTSANDWSLSPWNPAQINNYPEHLDFVKERTGWAADWFQLFSASQ